MTKPLVVFFGTGPVSLRCLEGLKNNVVFEAIITKPAALKPNGQPHAAPVADWAHDHNIPLYQPSTKAELAQTVSAANFSSQIGLVVDYGLIIPQSVIDSFQKGILNSHFSLLPEWRGADPITFAILSGQTATGVSIMTIVPALDEGDLLATASVPLSPVVTATELTEQLSDISNQLLISTIPRYLASEIAPTPQRGNATYSRKFTKADGLLDWSKPAEQLEREVRAFYGWPGSYTTLKDRDIIVTAAHIDRGTRVEPGHITATKTMLAVGTASGSLVIDRLKPAGKREMAVAEFLAGNPLFS